MRFALLVLLGCGGPATYAAPTSATAGTTSSPAACDCGFRVLEGPGAAFDDGSIAWCVLGELQPGEHIVSATHMRLGSTGNTGIAQADYWYPDAPGGLQVRDGTIGYQSGGDCEAAETVRVLLTTL